MAQRFRIRLAQAIDAVLLKKIYSESKDELGSFNLYQCWDFYLAGKNNEQYWVNQYGFVRWAPSKKYGANLIKDIGVLREYQGLLYGRQLLQSVPLPVVLKCNADNVNGNAFYKKMGMNQAGQTHTKKGRPQIIWTKTWNW